MLCKRNDPFGFFIWNKQTTEVFLERRYKDKNLGVFLDRYYPHEGDDNRIMFIVNSNEWIGRSPEGDNTLPKHLVDRINDIDNTIDEGSNPILLFYKEKSMR